jgi:hypothetical protein
VGEFSGIPNVEIEIDETEYNYILINNDYPDNSYVEKVRIGQKLDGSIFCFALVDFILSYQSLDGTAFSERVTVQDTDQGKVTRLTLAQNKTIGNISIAYVQSYTTTPGPVYKRNLVFAESVDDGVTFQKTQVNVLWSGNISGYDIGLDDPIALVTDLAGKHYIFRSTVTTIECSFYNGSSWNTTTIFSSANQIRGIDVLLDSGGVIHVAFSDITDNKIKYFYGSIVSWSAVEDADTSPSAFVGEKYPSLFDNNGSIEIVHSSFDLNGFANCFPIRWCYKSGGVWTTEIVSSSAVDDYFNDVSAESHDGITNVVATKYGSPSDSVHRYRKKGSEAWKLVSVTNYDNEISGPCMIYSEKYSRLFFCEIRDIYEGTIFEEAWMGHFLQ